MNILHYGIFNDHQLGGDIILAKGFTQNGHVVIPFDFKTHYKKLGVEKSEDQLLEQARKVDLVFIGKGEKLSVETLKKIKQSGVHTALWYGDIRIPVPEWMKQLLPNIDHFFMTSAGETLKNYHIQGMANYSSYFLNPSDSDLPTQNPSSSSKEKEIIFTGSAYGFAGSERLETINYLKTRNDVTFFGGADNTVVKNNNSVLQKIKREIARLNPNRKVRGEQYIKAIQSAKIGIGLNAFHNIDKYTSDRLTHYGTFGTFFLTHYFPGLYQLFENDEVISFNSIETLKIELHKYLHEESLRESIARKFQSRILNEYNTKKMTYMMLEIMATNQSTQYPWIEILKR